MKYLKYYLLFAATVVVTILLKLYIPSLTVIPSVIFAVFLGEKFVTAENMSRFFEWLRERR